MSVPYSMHAVGKVRENMKKDHGCGAGNSASAPKQAAGWQEAQKQAAGLQSYSSKMMKSIWGEYNRYSVHNFKSSQSAGQAGQAAPRGQNGQRSGLFQ